MLFACSLTGLLRKHTYYFAFLCACEQLSKVFSDLDPELMSVDICWGLRGGGGAEGSLVVVFFPSSSLFSAILFTPNPAEKLKEPLFT